MRPRYRLKVKKRGKRVFWSNTKRRSKTFRHHVVFHLPTRNKLTVAEAQRFVDVELDGTVHRLDVEEPLAVVCNPSEIFNGDGPEDSAFVCSQINGLKRAEIHNSKGCSGPQNGYKQCVRAIKNIHSIALTGDFQMPTSYCRRVEEVDEKMNREIEYDMDEQDVAWLSMLNEKRRAEKQVPISPNGFEYVIDRLEKESFAWSLVPKPSNSPEKSGRLVKEPCAVCLEIDCHPSNSMVSCDSCSMTVHQDCYGIPYVPDGPWICRICLRCTTKTTANCCLCPVAGGAMKQTDSGQFAHVICARWIPEVRFGSSVYLEPIEHVHKVPLWRRRLCCTICKSSGTGACIRCEMPRCDTAFHVTCALQAGIYMRLEMPRGASTCSRAAPPRRTVFCDLHRPVDTNTVTTLSIIGNIPVPKSSPLEVADDLKAPRSNQNSSESCSIPTKRLLAIGDYLCVRDKEQVISRLYTYWLLKRQVHSGWPLIHRLKYCAVQEPRVTVDDVGSRSGCCLNESDLDYLKNLRNSMIQAKKLLELIGDREKMKNDWIAVHERAINLQLQPLPILLHHTLDQLQARDTSGVFTHPVPLDEVPDYLLTISQPMDFSTMQANIDSHCYQTIDQFENDFQLMINNCLTYNEKGSFWHRIASKLQRECSCIISAARRMSERAGYCQETGLHVPSDALSISVDLLPFHHSYDDTFSTHAPANLSLEDELQTLHRRLDVLQVIRSHRNSFKCRMMRRRISVVKRQLTYQKQEKLGIKSPHRSPGRPRCKVVAQSPNRRMCMSASSRRSFQGEVGLETSPKVQRGIKRRRRLSLSPRNLVRLQNRQSQPTLPSPSRLTVPQPMSVQIHDKRTTSNDSAVLSCNGKETSMKCLSNNMVMDCSVVISALTSVRSLRSMIGASPNRSSVALNEQGRSAVTKCHNGKSDTTLAGQKTNLLNGCKRKLSDTECLISDLPNHRASAQKKVSTRIHMLSRNDASSSSVVVSETNENDSSYESSYSVISDSDVSNDVNGSFGVVNGFLHQQHLVAGNTDVAVKLKPTRSTYSIDAVDITTPIHKGDVVWTKIDNNPWYPAVVVRLPENVAHSGRKNGLSHSSTVCIPLPVPSSEVLGMQYVHSEPVYLVQLFDKQRCWHWLPRHKLEPLGQSTSQDALKIAQVKHWKSRAMVNAAFQEAIQCCYK